MKKWNIRHRPKYLLFRYQNVALLGCFSDIMLRNYHLILFFFPLPPLLEQTVSEADTAFTKHAFVCDSLGICQCLHVRRAGRPFATLWLCSTSMTESMLTQKSSLLLPMALWQASSTWPCLHLSFSSSGASPIASKPLCSANRAAADVPVHVLEAWFPSRMVGAFKRLGLMGDGSSSGHTLGRDWCCFPEIHRILTWDVIRGAWVEQALPWALWLPASQYDCSWPHVLLSLWSMHARLSAEPLPYAVLTLSL